MANVGEQSIRVQKFFHSRFAFYRIVFLGPKKSIEPNFWKPKGYRPHQIKKNDFGYFYLKIPIMGDVELRFLELLKNFFSNMVHVIRSFL